MIGAIKGLLSLATGGLDTYRQHKQNEANKLKRRDEMEQARHDSKVRRLQSGDEKAADLDMVSIKERGLKDEFIMLIVFIPLILSFFPDYASTVKAGFEALQNVPEYYWYVVAAIVIDTFGFRSMVRYLLEFFSYKFRGK